MFKRIEKQILDFVDTLPGIKMREVTHGTLYVTLEEDRDCDFIHKELRTFYKDFINPEGGVNMYFVGDEFAFDFVPAESEIPLYEGEKIRDEAKEESDIDIALNLEAESKEGK